MKRKSHKQKVQKGKDAPASASQRGEAVATTTPAWWNDAVFPALTPADLN